MSAACMEVGTLCKSASPYSTLSDVVVMNSCMFRPGVKDGVLGQFDASLVVIEECNFVIFQKIPMHSSFPSVAPFANARHSASVDVFEIVGCVCLTTPQGLIPT